jgi:hypothetical protein
MPQVLLAYLNRDIKVTYSIFWLVIYAMCGFPETLDLPCLLFRGRGGHSREINTSNGLVAHRVTL